MEVATSWRCDVVPTNQASSACCVFICVPKLFITPITVLEAKKWHYHFSHVMPAHV
jgi:hypothetical protein